MGAIEDKRKEIEKKKKEIQSLENEIEKLEAERKSRWETVLLDAMIIGAGGFSVRHGMVAPYTHAYTVKHEDFQKHYCDPVTCDKNWMKELPNRLYDYLSTQTNEWTDEKFEELEAETNKKWGEFPTSYDPCIYTPSDDYLHGRHVANGYERDGFSNIVKGKCFGTYSSCTTSRQNDLSKQLIVLKGFCPEIYRFNDEMTKEMLSDIYARHGIDSDLSDMSEWVKRNPNRCYID